MGDEAVCGGVKNSVTGKRLSGRNIVICDIDGTLADVHHRLHFITGEKKDWEAFYAASAHDTPIRSMVDLVLTLSKSYEVVFITTRPERTRFITQDWLYKLGFEFDFENLIMRADGDHREDFIVKWELFNASDIATEDVSFILEDRAQVVKMWRSFGLRCLQVADGDY